MLAHPDGNGIDEIALTLRVPNMPDAIPFTARAFRHVDSPSGRVVLLAAGEFPLPRA